jgi:P27 family predicted phage terminase small subunit
MATSMPSAPKFLTTEARAEWDRVSTQLRWVTAERAIAAMAAKDQLTSGLMIKTTNGNGIQNPLIGTANKAASDMVRYAAEFGLTPVARARLALSVVAPPKSKFDGLV